MRLPRNDFYQVGTCGFTLIEVLVSLVLLSLVLSVVLPIFSVGLGSAKRNEAAMVASNEAQSILATVGPEIMVVPGEVAGVLPDRHGWRVDIKPNHQLPDDASIPIAAFDVVVTISWSEGLRQRSTSLHTIRFGRQGGGR